MNFDTTSQFEFKVPKSPRPIDRQGFSFKQVSPTYHRLEVPLGHVGRALGGD